MPDMAMTMEAPSRTRRPSPQLAFGIAAMPLVFTWFTLRDGSSAGVRALSLGYAALHTLAIILLLTHLAHGHEAKPAPKSAPAAARTRPAPPRTPPPGIGFGVEPEPQGGSVPNPFTN